ncbi:breast cancer 2 susceptibility protein [Marchantia polymorpha subsp. ruderalis]|uniref:Tower domain-containing protein n=2 Tax=Marchantia polymorpha TaxID=3197 RepID=A0AAF6BTW3_MARPO|nr:hypothetical protein MARPO_0045s0096 [Marchantia polymorpha]BBN15447.1 hypothetical protein Mp_6g19670 [Marchantia polymorpha subsp. ruderalis]|eukprot:PTQ39441.1 hypothetical protein MARPO_0045s0096 [Marchantia polymorpha]
MSSRLESKEVQIWESPPKSQTRMKLSQDSNPNSRMWSYGVVETRYSFISTVTPIETTGERFAPSLQILKDQLDAETKKYPPSQDAAPACAGSKRRLEPTHEQDYVSSDGSGNCAKMKSSMSKPPAFKASTIRTSTQRRVRFLPDARADEQAVEGSASQEEVEEHTFPVLKKGRLSFGGSDVIQGLLARRESAPGPASICGERELSQIARPRALIVTPKVPEEVAPGKGVRTTELKFDPQVRMSDETRQNGSLMTPNSGTTSSVNDCEAQTKESRYGTLPVTLKRPELVSSVETLNKKAKRNADQSIAALWPTAGPGCAGPVRFPDESEGTLPSPVVPYCESRTRRQVPAVFEDSLVQDSQDDSESEGFPVAQNSSIKGCPKLGDISPQSFVRSSLPVRPPCDQNVENRVESVGNAERTHFDERPQREAVDRGCATDGVFRRPEGAKFSRSSCTGSRAESLDGLGAQVTVNDFYPGQEKRGECRGPMPPNGEGAACDSSSIRGYDAMPINNEELWRLGPPEFVSSRPAHGCGKVQELELFSNAFRTGKGNPVQISASAISRVASLFEDVSPGRESRANVFTPPKCAARNKTVSSSPALADAHSLQSVRKNLYHSSLSVQDVDCPEISLVHQARKAGTQGKTASLFQTARGLPVHVSAESIQRVQPIFSTPETLPSKEDVMILKPSVEDEGLAHNSRSGALSSRAVKGRANPSIIGGVNDGAIGRRDSSGTGSAGASRSNLFRTARDTPVTISSAALQKILNIFEDEDLTPPPSREGVGAIPRDLEEKSATSIPSTLPAAGFLVPVKNQDTSRELLSGCRHDANSLPRVIPPEVTTLHGTTPMRGFRTGFSTDHPEFTENAEPKSKLSPGEVVLRERANYIRYQWDRIFEPRLGFSLESRANRDISGSFAVEAGLGKSAALNHATIEESPYLAGSRHAEVRKDASLEGGNGSFSFKGSSGRTLTISSAAKAKAEALLKLGPEFVTPPKFEARKPSFEFRTKASKSDARSLLEVEERKQYTSAVNHGRKQAINDVDKRAQEKSESGSGRGSRAFKAPRILRPSLSLPDRRKYIGFQPGIVTAARRNFILPDGLHYLHEKKSRIKRGRLQLSEYFGGPPHPGAKTLSNLSKEVLSITADTAETYRIPDGGTGVSVDEVWIMLKDLGADQRYASKGWVANHFKWIVWKLASYDRRFPRPKACLLTLSSVLNELRYRYDRELNGERSALKRVTERDSSAGHTMVLCVSAVRSVKDIEHFYEIWIENRDNAEGNKAKLPPAGVIEVTDGWYRLNAHVDVPLARRIHSGKLKAGQKIVVCGATLEGLSDGLPPLQAFDNAYLCINSNGVRRARWDQRLGFCGTATPLAFKCITHDGGVIPHTYVAITRRYPLLHREKLAGGGYVLRSERAEDLAAHDFDKRRAKVAEEAIQKLEDRDSSSDEGAKLFFALETTTDPESLLLGMTRSQLDAFAAFKARREESRQVLTGDLIRNALELHGLASREVTPTFKVRVVGLNRKGDPGSDKDGLVTIWHATEELQEQLQEGKVFCVYGLRPSTKGSYHSFNSTRWQPVSFSTLEKHFEFPYVPRFPLPISNLSEYMPCREFDVVGLVLLVTDPVTRDTFRGRAKSQWAFMTDGSCAKGDAADAWEETQVLAIEISWPEQAFVSFEKTLVGSVVGYCNLWLKHRDQSNRLWVAEATERSHYSSKMTSPAFRHLTGAALEVQKWSKLNSWNVDILQSDVEQLAVHFENPSSA